VTMIVALDCDAKADARYQVMPLWKQPRNFEIRVVQQIFFAMNLLKNMWRFSRFLKGRPERDVLFGSFLEYLAPLWAWQFRKLARNGWKFATIIHDPVRDFVVGPKWWHEMSIKAGYSFVSHGFVHGPTEDVKDAGPVELVKIPFGQYPFPSSELTGQQTREALGIPTEAFVVLTFGHLRDGKNLDLMLKAIVDLPHVHLVVAGKEQSSGQKPASFYQSLARELGIAARCHFEVRYIRDSEIGGFFDAANINALTYSRDFRSASAALAAASHYRKPSLASSGEGPLKYVIQEYRLGVWVAPDCVDAIRSGLQELMVAADNCEWERYQAENSWQQNAKIVANTLGLAE